MVRSNCHHLAIVEKFSLLFSVSLHPFACIAVVVHSVTVNEVQSTDVVSDKTCLFLLVL
jgi:hypothetical protein